MSIAEHVNLRPLTEADVDVLDRMENDPSAVETKSDRLELD
ncbi:MAG: hypothetical protein WBA31_06290 [Candidatus Dormiibacterota bacterium]